MNKKVRTYVLGTLALLVWGFVAFSLYNAFYGGESPPIQQPEKTQETDPQALTDTFSINGNYRDPFLGKVARKKVQVKAVPKKKGWKPVKKRNVRWPAITYSGMIKNQSSGKEIAILNINGADQLLSIGDAYTEVEVVKIYKDSVTLMFNNSSKTIQK